MNYKYTSINEHYRAEQNVQMMTEKYRSENGVTKPRSAGGISNHMLGKVWDEMIYPFPNFNGCAVEVWEWINDFITHFIMDVIT